MTRGISVATLAALEADTAYPIYFAELRFDTGSPEDITRLHTWIGDITWGGEVWNGTGSMASVSLTEGIGIEPFALRLGLSGVDSDILDIVFTTQYWQRPCILYLGSMGSDGALVEDPSVLFSGFIKDMDMTIAAKDGDAVVLTAESEMLWFDKSKNVRYTDNQLQSEFSGDLGLEYLPQIAKRKIRWRGGSPESFNAGGGSTVRPSPREEN